MFHLRSTIEMPDEWLVVTPDGGGTRVVVLLGSVSTTRTRRSTSTSVTGSTSRASARQVGGERSATASRPPLPAEFVRRRDLGAVLGPTPFANRRFALSRSTTACDPEACIAGPRPLRHRRRAGRADRRRHTAFWDHPGRRKRDGRDASRRTSPARCGKRRVARVIESAFLVALRVRRARRARRRGRTGRAPRADVGTCRARRLEPQFEITERRLVTPDEALELSTLHSRDHAAAAGPRRARSIRSSTGTRTPSDSRLIEARRRGRPPGAARRWCRARG